MQAEQSVISTVPKSDVQYCTYGCDVWMIDQVRAGFITACYPVDDPRRNDILQQIAHHERRQRGEGTRLHQEKSM